MAKYNCRKCGLEYVSKKDKIKFFWCDGCGAYNKTKNLQQTPEQIQQIQNDTPTEQTTITPQVEDTKPQNISINVETIKTDLPRQNEQIKQTQQGLNTQVINKDAQGKPLTRAFNKDGMTTVFKRIDAVMVKKSNAQIWDVTEKEEEALGEQLADVLNEYFPTITSKEAKLATLMVNVGVTYGTRTWALVEAHAEKKAGKKKAEEKREEQNQEVIEEPAPTVNINMTSPIMEKTAKQKFEEQYKNRGK